MDVRLRSPHSFTIRLEDYEAKLAEGSIVEEVYGAPSASERHRHRYEVNNAYREQIAEAGLWFSGTSPDGHLVEYVELPRDVPPEGSQSLGLTSVVRFVQTIRRSTAAKAKPVRRCLRP